MGHGGAHPFKRTIKVANECLMFRQALQTQDRRNHMNLSLLFVAREREWRALRCSR